MLVPLPDLPLLFQTIVWTPHFAQQTNKSAFTGRRQTIGQPGNDEWSATAHALAPATMAEMWAWDAFLAACRGSENTFHLPALALPQTSAANPLVTAAVTGDRAVTVASAAAVKLGMYATVVQGDGHARLVKVVGIDGLDVHFEPGLTAAPDIGEAFVIGEPYATMRLPNPDQPLTTIGEAFQFEAEEAL